MNITGRFGVDEAIQANRGNNESDWRKAVELIPLATQRLVKATKYPGEVPKVSFVESDEFEACVTREGEIVISLHILRFSLDWERNLIDADVAKESNGKLLVWVFTLVVVQWVVSHEFIHLARSHFDVIERLGDRCLAALEYDADLSAVFMVYQMLRGPLQKNLGDLAPIEVKKIVLHGMFWAIRIRFLGTFSETNGVGPYLAWFERLKLAAMKLGMTDHIDREKIGRDDWFKDPAYREDMTALWHEIILLERQFRKMHGLPELTLEAPGDLAAHFGKSDPCAIEVINLWREVEPHVLELQLVAFK